MKHARQGSHAQSSYALFVGLIAVAAWAGPPVFAPTSTAQVTAPAQFEWALEAPDYASIDHVIQTMGLDANNRMALRMQPLIDSGLLQVLIDALPEEQLEEYTGFVEESGIDPADSLTGILAYTDRDLGEDEPVSAVVLVGIEDGADFTDFAKFMEQKAEADEDAEDDEDEYLMAFLFEQQADEMEALLKFFESLEDESSIPYATTHLSNATISTRVEEERIDCTYIWSGGVLGLVRQVDSGDPFAVAQETIAEFLGELAAAAEVELEPRDSRPTLTATGTMEDVEVGCLVNITESTTMHLVLGLSPEAAEELRPAVEALPFIQENPESIADQFPEEYYDLVEAVLNGTEASMFGSELTLLIELENETIEELVENM